MRTSVGQRANVCSVISPEIPHAVGERFFTRLFFSLLDRATANALHVPSCRQRFSPVNYLHAFHAVVHSGEGIFQRRFSSYRMARLLFKKEKIVVSEYDALILSRPHPLDILILEQESALAAGGCRETNSELSRVLDELDLAAAGDSPATTAPQD